MAKGEESYNKKDVRKKQEQKRKEKEKKREEKKEQENKSSFDDMIAYVDAQGNITSTPPDPEDKEEINAEDIELGIPKKDKSSKNDPMREGIVIFFNDSKGYGFIRESESNQSVFVHANNLEEPITENNKVSFEITQGTKGYAALNVKIIREEN